MRHLHHDRKAEPAALCGAWARHTVHYSKARRTDCARCRTIHRGWIWRDRAKTLRGLEQRTEFVDVARDYHDRASQAELEAAARGVTILSVRPPDAGPRRSFLVGEIRLAVAKFGGDKLADLIVGHLQAGPQLPAEPARAIWSSQAIPCTPFLHQFHPDAEGSDPCRCGHITYRSRP